MASVPAKHPVAVSIGIMAWNEENSIRATLESLLRQSIFEKLAERGEACEVVVVANGCTDATAAVAREVLERAGREHPRPDAVVVRVVDLPEPGKCNAWNRFVHEFSSLEARFLVLMDADIAFCRRDTIFTLVATLERTPRASASSGRACKDILFKARKSLRDRVSLATSDMSASGAGMICGQLYCLRSQVARRIHLPRGLGAVEDGFIKAVVCTDFFTRPTDLSRVVGAPEAAHLFEAYTTLTAVLNNQKRQMIGQATVHVLVERLRAMPVARREALADTLRELERCDPDWLRHEVSRHLQATRRFWRVFPGALSFRWRRWWKLRGAKRLTHLPATLVGFAITLTACWRAHRALRRGAMHYWPKATRQAALSAARAEAPAN